MSHVPNAITPEYVLIETRFDFSPLKDLKFPEDKLKMAGHSLSELQVWYAAQDPHDLMEMGDDFLTWWKWHYLVPLRCKRLIYKLKFW